MSIIDLTKKLERVNEVYSSVDLITSGNVRPSSLMVNNWYIMFIYHMPKNKSPYMLVKFIGSGKQNKMEKENIKLVNIKHDEYYWFEAYDTDDNEFYQFGAHVFDNKLCVTEKSKRISFKLLKDQPSD